MIRRLAAAGGVMHITFHNTFLSQEYATANRALAAENDSREEAAEEKFGQNEARKMIAGQQWVDESIRTGKLPQVRWEKILDHIDHAVGIAGPDHVGLGSDFDGAYMPAGMEDASEFPDLTEGMLARGYTEADIRKILGENTLRVMAEAQRVGQLLSKEKP